MRRYIVGDTETTGLKAPIGVCEIAWREIDAKCTVVERVHSRIDPQKPICPSASGVHGITNDDVNDMPTLDEFFNVVRKQRIDGDVVLIGHNIDYDLPFFKPYCGQVVDTLCTLRLSKRFWPDAPNHKLSTMLYYLGLTRGNSHSADDDVLTSLEILCLVMRETELTVEQLIEEAKKPIRIKKMPFGMHFDKPLAEVPASYVSWLMRQSDVDPDLIWSLKNPEH